MERSPEPTQTPDTPGREAATGPVALPRQRWRLKLARAPGAPALAGRELTLAWEAALELVDLPLTRVGRGPARIAFGAPLPVGMAAEGELAEILLTERCPIWRVREALAGAMPDGWRLVTVEDVWLGAPSLPGLVAAADHRIELGHAGVASTSPDGSIAHDAAAPESSAAAAAAVSPAAASMAGRDSAFAASVAAAAAALLRAARLPRERTKGNGVVAYDLRPLLVEVRVADAGPPIVVRTRTLLHPTLGTGRPEEVVAALAEAAGMPLVMLSIVRERLVLDDELSGSKSG